MNRADRWLHRQRRALRDWHADGPADGVTELLQDALAGIEALEAAKVLEAGPATAWRTVLEGEAAGRRSVTASDEIRRRAQRHLARLLDAQQPDPEWDDPNAGKFEAAVDLFSAVGAVDAREWSARFRERVGWPSEEERADELALNADGTEVDLLEVVPGPAEARRGYRLLLVLRFADGVSFMLDKDAAEAPDVDWPEWRLIDDAGTSYSGGDDDEHVSFCTAVPSDATWIELTLEEHPDVSFRVSLV